MPKPQKPEYENVTAGDVIVIGDDLWYVANITYYPEGWNAFEGAIRENDTDRLGLTLLRVNPEKP